MLNVLDESYHARLATCVRCDNREQRGEVKVCKDDGVSIFEHAGQGECPRDRYAELEPVAMPGGAIPAPKPAPPPTEEQQLLRELQAVPDERWGDVAERWAKKVRGDKAAELFTRLTRLPCGCASRKEWLNRLERWVKGPMTERLRDIASQGAIDRASKAG